jgi:hypothetical protein
MTAAQMAARITGEPVPDNLAELQTKRNAIKKDHLGTIPTVDATNLAQSGWGIIFLYDKNDPARDKKNKAIQEALSELLKLRQAQAGAYFKIFEGPGKVGGGYRRGETKRAFTERNGVGVGPVDPAKGIPYYVLIVGGPADIPFTFQYQLDVQFAVGRIDFGDDLDAYARYAQSVVLAETGQIRLPRKLSFFGVEHPGDPATELSVQRLIQPLYDKFSSKSDWSVESFVREQASRAQLERLVGGDQTPALLFTASHGMEFPKGDARQLPHQGALLCSDFPGPAAWRGRGPIPEEHYFAGDHLASNANLAGLLTFYFACYGAGTPLKDEFYRQFFIDQAEIAPCPFIANLPKQMLKRGALACVGHVERAWGCSFFSKRAGEQTTTFEAALDRLLMGHPLGSAIEYFNERYAEISTDLNETLDQISGNQQYDDKELVGLWTANNDARGYVIIGDPAVRLPVAAATDAPAARPVIDVARPIVISPPVRAARPKPAEIAQADWDKTPQAVQEFVIRLLEKQP